MNCTPKAHATRYNVITEIYKALITIACKTISFFALKVQHNLAQGNASLKLRITNDELRMEGACSSH